MINALIASAALLAGTALAGAGSAIVINQCDYDVYLANTPAAGGGASAVSQTLSTGGSYSQVYTELTNGDGWSLKLSKTAGAFGSNIMQYEYTYHNDGTIWFDLSDVNGNPWNGNWEITADNGCTPKQTAYQYSTDDAYGMQACNDDASVTVTLCSGNSGGSGASPAASAPSTVSTPSVAPVESRAPWTGGPPAEKVGTNENGAAEVPADSAPTPSPSTFATSTTSYGTTVTNVQYEVVTQYVTATSVPSKRHEHHPRHAHHHRF